jgi:predicted SAM-dependent methyltransferase
MVLGETGVQTNSARQRLKKIMPQPILDGLRFRFWAVFGPWFRKGLVQAYLNRPGPHGLHIGCGPHLLQGWLNTDLVPARAIVAYLDATHSLPFPNASFDYVFSEHMIEHISYRQGRALVTECARVLKPGGTIRIATPDLQFLIDLYTAPVLNQVQQSYVVSVHQRYFPELKSLRKSAVINNLMHNYGHQFIYDEAILTDLLGDAGFGNVRRVASGQSDDPHLCEIEHHGSLIKEEFNILQTMVLEATRSQ